MTSEVVQAGGGASCITCGNSPRVNSYVFHDVNKYGLPNSAGLRLTGFQLADGRSVVLDVQGGRLFGRDGALVYAGAKLKNSVMVLRDAAGQRYAMQVMEVGASNYWAELPGGTHPAIEVYTLGWAVWPYGTMLPPASVMQPVCPDPVDENDSLGLDRGWATLYEGDRIDGKRYTVNGVDTSWFNVGCAGHLVAKLALTGHTHAAQSVGFVTTTSERTTMVKLLAADYCGVGKVFTVQGQPLTWGDHRGWMDLWHPNLGIEAIWGPTGALCLDVPRCESTVTDGCAVEFPGGVKDAIEATCTLPPPCTGGSAHLVSANI